MKIMLIDDSEIMLKHMIWFISEYGYEIEGYGNPVEAVEAFGRGSYDAVITDYQMPEMNGLEVLQQIRAIDPGAVVIMISGSIDPELPELAKNGGALTFFRKPMNLAKFLSTLDRISGRETVAGGVLSNALPSSRG